MVLIARNTIMATPQSSSKTGFWDSSSTIEALALVLTVPGAVAALVTLWIQLARRREKLQG
jgi:hypothetical protein